MNDFLVESHTSYDIVPTDLQRLFNDCLKVVEKDNEPVPVRPLKLILEVGLWVRLNNGNVYQIKKMGKSSKAFCGMEKKKRKDGTFYMERAFKEEKSIIVYYNDPLQAKEINEIVYETDILMTSFFIMDCIFKGDRIYTSSGTVEVTHKSKTRKGTLLECRHNGCLVVVKEQDIIGFDNSAKRGNIIRSLSVDDEVKDRFHGWGTVTDITNYKVFVKSPNFKRPYILAESQIIDYKNKYDD